MLTVQQKKAIRTMLSVTNASPDRMAEIGADDVFALEQLSAFVAERTPVLDAMYSDELGKMQRAQTAMQNIDAERVIWNEAMA